MNDLGLELTRAITVSTIERYRVNRQRTKREIEAHGYKVVFAHELAQCSRKTSLSEQLQILDLTTSWRPPVILGEIIERGVEHYMRYLGFVPPPRPWSKIVNVGSEVYTVVGSPDFVDDEEKPRRVVDVKFTSADPKARGHHVTRMRIYLWLTGAQEGVLLYVSPSGLKAYTVSETMTDREVASLIENRQSPMWDWECRLCPFEPYCNQSTTGGRDE